MGGEALTLRVLDGSSAGQKRVLNRKVYSGVEAFLYGQGKSERLLCSPEIKGNPW